MSDVGDYWKTWTGISERLEMFSQRAVYGIYNASVDAAAEYLGGAVQYWTSLEFPGKVCDSCSPYDGAVYRKGQFKPYIPRHFQCRCLWGSVAPEES